MFQDSIRTYFFPQIEAILLHEQIQAEKVLEEGYQKEKLTMRFVSGSSSNV